jgi:tetratricopeptide (TPR) repeat protein
LHYLEAVAVLERFARERYGCGVLALAIRWVLDQGETVALWGARRPAQLDTVADAFGWELDAEAKRHIDELLQRTVRDPVGRGFWRRRRRGTPRPCRGDARAGTCCWLVSTERGSDMKRILIMVVLVLVAVTAWAIPSVETVQAEVGRGNYAQAENMMREVVAADPGSARAHYIYAEILAHLGHFDQAAQQAGQARQIAPDLGFTQPERFRAFEQLLERERRAALHSPAAQSRAMGAPAMQPPARGGNGGVPGWAWGLGAVALASMLWRAFSPGPRGASMPAELPVAGPAGPGPAGYGPSPPATAYGPNAGPAAAGSGLLGTGLAAAGGVAAGMLVEKLLDERGMPVASGGSASGGGNGFEPRIMSGAPETDPAASELEQRPVDFGSGEEWNGGATDSGMDSGLDLGGGDDGGNGGW